MLIETDWLNVLVDRGEHKGYTIQADQVWFCTHVPGQLGIVFVTVIQTWIIVGEWKKVILSVGLRATCFSSGRRIWFWSIRVAVDDSRHSLHVYSLCQLLNIAGRSTDTKMAVMRKWRYSLSDKFNVPHTESVGR